MSRPTRSYADLKASLREWTQEWLKDQRPATSVSVFAIGKHLDYRRGRSFMYPIIRDMVEEGLITADHEAGVVYLLDKLFAPVV